MRWIKMTVIGAILAVGNMAKANDDVMIDLTVLNGLDNAYDYAEPQFPIINKQVPTVDMKKRTTPKVKQPEAAKKQVKAEIKPVEKPAAKEAFIKQVANQVNVVVKPEEDVVVVDVEPTTPLNNSAAVTAEQPAVPEPKAALSVSVDNVPGDALLLVPVQENAVDKPYQEKVNSLNTEQPESLPVSVNHNDDNQIVANALKFEENEYELSDENKEQLDLIVKDFHQDRIHKIAIYAYNLDAGVDSFRRKRLSLNRAIEVRSYLLRKGFKNFSIKVVNISQSSPKANTVEIEEI